MTPDGRSADSAGDGFPYWQRALLVIGMIAVVWLIVRSTALAIVGSAGAAPLARIVAPDSAAALIDTSGIRMAPARRPTGAQRSLLRRAAERSPLRYEPFYAQALVEQSAGRWPQAVRAGESARDRQPRTVAVRGMLLQAYLRQGRYAQAILEMNAIMARSVTANENLLQLLTMLSDEPRTSAYVEAALRKNPRWRAPFIEYAGIHAANKAPLFKTLVTAPAGDSADQQRVNQTAFVNGLVQAGDYERAYLAWVNFLSPEDVARVQPVYDGDFRGYGGVAPFNWTLTNSASATTERTRDTILTGGHALDVQFFGGSATDLATQTLLVPPGTYDFSALASGSNDSRFGGALYWQITCLPSGKTTQLARLTNFPTAAFRIGGRIIVSESGCVAQKLTLRGEAGEISALIAAQFTDIRLVAR